MPPSDWDALWSRERWWLPAAVYLLVLVCVYVGGVIVGSVANDTPTLASVVYRPLLFPGLFVIAPALIAVVAAFLGFRPLASITLGLSVGVGFTLLGVLATILGTSGNGDSQLWALSLFFAGAGLVTAAAGHVLGAIVRRVTDESPMT